MSGISSRPYHPTACCEACVFGHGEHAEWCEKAEGWNFWAELDKIQPELTKELRFRASRQYGHCGITGMVVELQWMLVQHDTFTPQARGQIADLMSRYEKRRQWVWDGFVKWRGRREGLSVRRG